MTTVRSRGTRNMSLAFKLLFVSYASARTILALLAVTAGLVLAWAASYSFGGSHTALPHLFYLPVILAAVRFSWNGALAAAVTAGLLAGPALPADVATHSAQPMQGWLLRLVIFVLVGMFVTWLARGQSEPFRDQVSDALVSLRLIQGLKNGEVEVYYQPILDLAEGKIVAFEALARWQHSARGPLNPDEFVPQAERTGAITSLDKHVLWEAARQIQTWSTHVGPVGVSVNVSATRFAQQDLPEQVARVLQETGLPAKALHLEITESAIIDDIPAAANQIAQLRALGVRVAIDDFGAGQSSLSYLKHFTVDSIKIDRGLITEIHEHRRTEQLVSGLIRMFRGLQVDIVAEGVENAEQYVLLQSTECSLAQGYFIGRPASAKDTEDLLKGRRSPVGAIPSLYLDMDWA